MIHFPVYSLANVFIYKYIPRYNKHVNIASRSGEIEQWQVTLQYTYFTCGDSVDTFFYHTYNL